MASEEPNTVRREIGEAVTMTAGPWKVHGYVQRRPAQEPDEKTVATSRWPCFLMNWGHDPLKKG